MRALAEPAQYLLRIDDLCPTVDRGRWRQLRDLIKEFDLQPILGVVPDNCDPELAVSGEEAQFWEDLRAMQANGATVALHGFQHRCVSRGKGILRRSRLSEFAGVDEETQRAWIRAGLRILRGQGLAAKVWIAPRHGFDRATLRVLRAEGICFVSDGFARQPFLRGGLVWIPQQLWAGEERGRGLWTICLHPNTETDLGLRELRWFVRTHRRQFTDLESAIGCVVPRPLSWAELASEWHAEARLCWRRARSRACVIDRGRWPPIDREQIPGCNDG